MSPDLSLSVAARDGIALRTHRWPAVGAPRGHLLLVHGIAEHAARYDHVAARFATAGLETQAFDLRGFGGSGGERAYIARWSVYHDDLEDRLEAVRAVAGDLPVILYGHSMGALIALGYMLADRPRLQPDRLVLSAPAIDSPVAGWKRMLAPALGHALPHLRIANDLAAGGLSRDPAVEAAYRSDPLNTHTTTARLGMELFREQARVARRLGSLDRLPVPTYVLHGADDRIVPGSASARLAGKELVTRRVYPGMRHETHNEIGVNGV
ncbi:MAG TPA: lysophospholipase, partial [Candidatus Saccharimonadales bacterium]|nr:lysophospholipase [Candidatus Saccharimonadales bacterium]